MTAISDRELAPFTWGDLQHHDSECDACEGRGFDDDGAPCSDCGERGSLRWGSFYEQDRGECELCEAANMPIAAMFEDTYVCLPCWLRAHARDCGCDLWRAAELEYGIGADAGRFLEQLGDAPVDEARVQRVRERVANASAADGEDGGA